MLFFSRAHLFLAGLLEGPKEKFSRGSHVVYEFWGVQNRGVLPRPLPARRARLETPRWAPGAALASPPGSPARGAKRRLRWASDASDTSGAEGVREVREVRWFAFFEQTGRGGGLFLGGGV